MFKNPGKQIKVIAMIYFVIVLLASIILAFSLGIKKEYHYNRWTYETEVETKVQPTFYAFFFGGQAYAYVSSLLLTGFGELVEKVSKMSDTTEKAASQQESASKKAHYAAANNQYPVNRQSMAQPNTAPAAVTYVPYPEPKKTEQPIFYNNAPLPVNPAPVPQAPVVPQQDISPNTQPEAPAAARDYRVIGEIKCPRCGCVQPSVRKRCWECGADLK